MKAFVQFMLSIGSMSSLDTSALTQILLLSGNDDDEDLEPEASELGQRLKLQFDQQPQEIVQCFEVKAATWAIAAELENEDGSFVYQFVRL